MLTFIEDEQQPLPARHGETSKMLLGVCGLSFAKANLHIQYCLLCSTSVADELFRRWIGIRDWLQRRCKNACCRSSGCLH